VGARPGGGFLRRDLGGRRADLGGLARFEVLWQSGTKAEVLIGPHEDQLCILASRFISGGSVASAE
jgi:hypothetical protein